MAQKGSQQKVALDKSGCAQLPRIHRAAFEGNLFALRSCIQDGEEVNGMINLPNSQHHLVIGVTPLYLAAQAGHKDCCQLLVQHGADVLRQCAIPQSGDVCGPTDIALVHFHFKTWYYLSNVKKQRLSKVQHRSRCHGTNIVEPLIDQSDLVL